jgi:hypothetical protein
MKGTLLMTGSVAAMLGLLLVIVLMITVFVLVRRKRRLSSPKARYQRDIRALRTSVYLRTVPRPARQTGVDGQETQYGGGAWLG